MRARERRGDTGWRQRGVSLVELMVGVTLGMVLTTLVMRGLVSSSSQARLSSLVSEAQTNGRYALDVLRRELRHAGFGPLLWEASQLQVNSTAAAASFGCGAGVNTALKDAGFWAANDGNPFSANCLAKGTGRKYVRGDVVVVRRLSSRAVTSFATKAPYVRVSYGAGHLFLGGETPASLPAPAYDHALLTEVYYINEFTNSATETPKVPALYRLRLSSGANPSMVPELVASNVEHLQVQVGLEDAAGNVRFVDPGSSTDWAAVVSARIWLLQRATSPEPGLAGTTHAIGDVSYGPADGYRRTVLSTLVHLRNR